MARDLFKEFDANPCFSDLVAYAPADFEEVLRKARKARKAVSNETIRKAEEATSILQSLKQYRKLLSATNDADRRDGLFKDIIHESFRLGQIWNDVKARRHDRSKGGTNSSPLTEGQWSDAHEHFKSIRPKLKTAKDAYVRTAVWIKTKFGVELDPPTIRSHV